VRGDEQRGRVGQCVRSGARPVVVGGIILAALAVLSVCIPGARAGLTRGGGAGGQAVVAHNDKAAIFDTLGSSIRGNSQLIADIRGVLKHEHYDVTEYSPVDATVPNFVRMASDSVIVFSTHGLDPSIASRERECQFAKSLFTSYEHQHPSSARPPVLCANPAIVLAQTIGPTIEAYQDYSTYLLDGYSDRWIQPIDASGGTGIALTALGVRHFFSGRHIDLVFGSACYSLGLASEFDARSYFGYFSTTYDCETLNDGEVLFDRLAGHSGVDARNTVQAYGLGGFSATNFHLASGADPVVLSPAVKSVSPGHGTVVKNGALTRASVTFDAKMVTSHPSGIVRATGCRASIRNASWDGSTELDFDIRVPKRPPAGKLRLTIDPQKARGAPGDSPNDQLDGNQHPSPQSGTEPNDTAYVWTLACKAKAHRPPKHRPRPRKHVKCPPAKGSVCVVFDGTISSTWSAPNLTAVSSVVSERWHLVWTLSYPGYGVPNTLARGSDASGHEVVTYFKGSSPPTCTTGFYLTRTYAPTLTEGNPYNNWLRANTKLTIGVPNPSIASTGNGGGGYPSIGPTNPNCPALGTGFPPGSFSVRVRLTPGTTTHPVSAHYSVAGPPSSDEGDLSGTITVVVGGKAKHRHRHG
jgi:hypothetical protein